MILYFTGTGNSEYVAEKIAKGTNQTTLNLFQKIRDNDRSALHSDEPWIIVCPTYAWRIPRVLEQWLRGTKLSGNERIYFVMTCGGSIGNAGKYLKSLCRKKGLDYSGCYEVVMPENYIALFTTPSQPEALSIIENAQIEINKAIQMINDGLDFPEPQISLNSRISSGIVNDIFYPACVHAKKISCYRKMYFLWYLRKSLSVKQYKTYRR